MKQITHRSITPWVMLLLLTVLASPALAIPYLISYEADTPRSFPEDEGWDRGFGFGGADRTIENGILTLSSDNISVFDFYQMDMGGNLDPDPSEVFFAEWRMRVDAISGGTFGDPGVTIARDGVGGPFGGGDVSFVFKEGEVFEIGDPVNPKPASFAPGVFHVFRFESDDMLNYQFYIDGLLSITGTFDVPSVNMSFVSFGDGVQGVSSTSAWDYLRFGVVPEPASVLLVATGLGVCLANRSKTQKHR